MIPSHRVNSAVLVIGEGAVTALAGGPLSLADLGERKTRRVSTVEFSDLINRWVVTDQVTKEILFEDDDYDVALKWEVDHYNQLLSFGAQIPVL